ncbi:MAG: hypothetical protein K8I02_11110, partial [Candidatus Methylomirabilis sp.]|nr:hypothetical protein [Deltaproteobacteria bacterium]
MTASLVLPGGASAAGGPDLIRIAEALGLADVQDLSDRARKHIDGVLGEEKRLRKDVERLGSHAGGDLYLRGETLGEERVLVWRPSAEDAAPLPAPADFVVRARTANQAEERATSAAFRTLAPISPEEMLEFSKRLVEALDGSDDEVRAAFRRDFPGISEVVGRVVSLDETRALRREDGYTVIDIEAPLNADGLREHYKAVGKLIRWMEEIGGVVTDAAGRIVYRVQLDNDDGVVRFRAFKKGRDLLWSDGEKPLRDAEGNLIPVEFDLARDQRFAVHGEATLSLLKIGSVRLGSLQLPWSEWDVRYEANEGVSPRWSVRLAELGEPNAFLGLFLPLDELHAAIRRSFMLTLGAKPEPDRAGLYGMNADFQLRFPRSAVLDMLQDLSRWVSRSRVLRDGLRLGRDFAE